MLDSSTVEDPSWKAARELGRHLGREAMIKVHAEVPNLGLASDHSRPRGLIRS